MKSARILANELVHKYKNNYLRYHFHYYAYYKHCQITYNNTHYKVKSVSIFFLLLFFYLMRDRDIRRMIPFALLGAGLTWLVFEKILGVVVPQPFWLGLF